MHTDLMGNGHKYGEATFLHKYDLVLNPILTQVKKE